MILKEEEGITPKNLGLLIVTFPEMHITENNVHNPPAYFIANPAFTHK